LRSQGTQFDVSAVFISDDIMLPTHTEVWESAVSNDVTLTTSVSQQDEEVATTNKASCA
jgi:hypothetical protein